MIYLIKIDLVDSETEEHYLSFKQEVYNHFNTSDFSNIVEMFNELVAFVQSKYDTEETYEMTAHILDENNTAIF